MTRGSARANDQATSQPKNGPRPSADIRVHPARRGQVLRELAIEEAVNSTAIIANRTASGVMAPANAVAAPMERAVATAGAMCVIDWNRSSVSPIALRARFRRGSSELHGSCHVRSSFLRCPERSRFP